jgi:predicted Zn-dependent protease
MDAKGIKVSTVFGILCCMLILDSCSRVELTGRRQLTAIPNDQIVMLGKETYQQVLKEERLSGNREYTSIVQSVGQRVSQAVEEYMRENGMGDRIDDYAWEYRVLESDAINAWCLPGGKIAFYEGIMPVCRDETGVATVMAHEVAHVIAQHSNERMSQQLAVQLGGLALSEALDKEKESTQQLALAAFGIGSQVGILLPYSRTHEREADEMGLYFMAMAGYDPREAPGLWVRMKERQQNPVPEFLSTHPHPDSRIQNLNKHMAEALEYYNRSR